MRTWTLDLPLAGAPLSLNDRAHWSARSRGAKTIREAVGWLCREQRIPALASADVTLRVFPPDRRRRDEDNLVATLKPCLDGIVDAGVLTDDTPAYVSSRVRLAPYDGSRRWRYLLEIAEVSA